MNQVTWQGSSVVHYVALQHPSSVLRSGYCLYGVSHCPLDSLVSSHLMKYAMLLAIQDCVNEFVNMCVRSALWSTVIPSRVYSNLTPDSRSTLTVYMTALTEDEWMQNSGMSAGKRPIMETCCPTECKCKCEWKCEWKCKCKLFCYTLFTRYGRYCLCMYITHQLCCYY